MTTLFNKHFQKNGDHYLMSPAAVLAFASDAMHDPDASANGKERAARLIAKVVSAARAAKFEQADILETMLVSGASTTKLLPICDAVATRVGGQIIIDLVRQCLGTIPPGEAA